MTQKDERKGIQLPVIKDLYEIVPKIMVCPMDGEKMTPTSTPAFRRWFKCPKCGAKKSFLRIWYDHVPGGGVSRTP